VVEAYKLYIKAKFTERLKLSPEQGDLLMQWIHPYFNYRDRYEIIKHYLVYFYDVFIPWAWEHGYFSYWAHYTIPRFFIKHIRQIEHVPLIAEAWHAAVDLLRYNGVFRSNWKDRGMTVDTFQALIDKNKRLRKEAYAVFGLWAPRDSYSAFWVHFDRSRADDIVIKGQYILFLLIAPFFNYYIWSKYDVDMSGIDYMGEWDMRNHWLMEAMTEMVMGVNMMGWWWPEYIYDILTEMMYFVPLNRYWGEWRTMMYEEVEDMMDDDHFGLWEDDYGQFLDIDEADWEYFEW
jgi:hypothetical protein